MAMTGLESLTWICGIYFLEEGSHYKGLIFLLAILLSFRIPDTFLSNDFHAACSKSGVLFNTFAWISCPEHHIGRKSLLWLSGFAYVPRAITFWELCGDHRTDCTWYYSTSWKFWTVLFLGVVSHMAAVTALPANCKMLICGGFTGVILSIGLIKSMHLRRVPLNPSHRQLLYAAYTIQVIALLTVAYATASMSINRLSTQL